MMEEWRLREEVSGRFENVLGNGRNPDEDTAPGRVVLWEHSDVAAQRITEMLKPVVEATVRVKSPEELGRSFIRPADLVILGLGGPFDALRLVGQLRSADEPVHAGPADRR